MNRVYDVIVVGAGQSGLATGYYLRQAGLSFLILEAGDEAVGSWPYFYDSLSLNSTARYSSLPGLPFPGDPDHYPVRDEAVAYLRRYATHFDLPIVTNTPVDRIERKGQLFHLATANNRHYVARAVVAATGFFGRPHMPEIPGQSRYRGQVLHAADYRRPEPFQGQRIIIVGGANGAVQIGTELAQVARVTLAARHPIRYLPQRVLGRDIHFWLTLSGLDRTQWLNEKSPPVYDTGAYRAAIATGRPEQKPMFSHFTEQGVVWGDGRHEAVDTVIFATGYQPNLPYLTGLGALDSRGRALQRKGASTSVPGLYYVGLMRQRSVASATLRGVGSDAKMVVNSLRHYCHTQQVARLRRAREMSLARQVRIWNARGNELVGLINLITLALQQQLATGKPAAPKLLGEALGRSLLVGAGFLGVGHAAALYSRS